MYIHNMNEELIKTGIPKLDVSLGGGLRAGSITIFWAIPGIENAPFVYHVLTDRLSAGDSGIYVAQTKRADTVEAEIKHYGWDITEYKEKGSFCFIDAYSGLIHAPSNEKFVVKDAKNPKAITQVLEQVLAEKSNHKIVVFDSISTLIDHCGEKSLEELRDWKKLFGENKATGIFLFTEWPYDTGILDKIKSLADAVIQLNAIEEKVILREYFTVPKVGWDGKEKKDARIPFKISKPGGIRVYIPKILVTGPYNAGKSSFVHSASTKAVSVERVGTTIALDHGHVDYKGFSVDLFGTPGQERFDPILEYLGGEALGVIVIIDSTDSETFPRAKEMLKKSKSIGLPYVIVANKANLQNSLSPNEIREKMNLPKEISIIPVTAKTVPEGKEKLPAVLKLEDVHKVFDVLFGMII